MPDILKYSSVSVNKKTYKELKAVSAALSTELGMKVSLAKTIEHLATQKAKQLGLNGHSKS
jgi:hypothetical protein|tara:strand:+ start:3735 stop:3917 length:183 start_codon:yes stop_codon:yes gene_type:complete